MYKEILLKIIKISRPRFWTYLFGTYAIGYLSGITNLIDVDLLQFLLYGLYFLIPANVLIYSVNDYFDVDVDKHNSKKQSKEYIANKSDLGFLRKLIVISLAISCLPILLLPNTAQLVFLLFLFLGIFYSATPFRFKNKVILDHLSNSFYFFPAIIGYYLSSSRFIPLDFFVAGLAWTSAMHLFSAIPDISADKSSGTTTTATMLDTNKSLVLCALYWCVFGILVTNVEELGFIRYFSFVYIFIPVYLLNKPAKLLENIYWKFPILNGFAGALTFLVILINKI